MKQKLDKKKQNGEVFTPERLANFLADHMLPYMNIEQPLKINDPSCGDGALLFALTSKMIKMNANPFSVFGSDNDEKY